VDDNCMMIQGELIKRLLRLDEDVNLLFEDRERFRLIIVGGGALILQEYLPRATHDIDVVEAPPEIVDLLERYDINCHVMAYINNFPYNFEDRIISLALDTKKIDFFVASLEDIVVAKLYSVRSVDRHDIEMPELLKHLDWGKLHNLVINENEAKANALNERNYNDMLFNYTEYVARCKKCVG